jgi:very-short-patch-repair endonuclease
MRKKLDSQYIKKVFEREQYKLLSEYCDFHSKIDCVCPLGHKTQISWSKFCRGHRCADCAGNVKLTIQQIEKYLTKEGYVLLPSEYKNAQSKINYCCSKGHEHQMRWTCFQQGRRCPDCKKRRRERELGRILEQIFPGEVKQQDDLGFLNLQRVDYSVRKFKLVFEHNGAQHYKPVDFGQMTKKQAEERFRQQKERDKRREKLCRDNEYTFIPVKYYEVLRIDLIYDKIVKILGKEKVCVA